MRGRDATQLTKRPIVGPGFWWSRAEVGGHTDCGRHRDDDQCSKQLDDPGRPCPPRLVRRLPKGAIVNPRCGLRRGRRLNSPDIGRRIARVGPVTHHARLSQPGDQRHATGDSHLHQGKLHTNGVGCKVMGSSRRCGGSGRPFFARHRHKRSFEPALNAGSSASRARTRRSVWCR
jgi:hypothetical protein